MFDLIPFGKRDKDIFDYLDTIERKFFEESNRAFNNFRIDIKDNGDRYKLMADLPGIEKKDINIEVKNDVLVIKAELNEEVEKKSNENYIHKERKHGIFTRSFNIGNVKKDEITADYKNGVLTLELPKKEIKQPENLKIEIK